jgi:prefoldin subunit 5
MSGEGGGEAGHVSGEGRVYAEQVSASLADLAARLEGVSAAVDAHGQELARLRRTEQWVSQVNHTLTVLGQRIERLDARLTEEVQALHARLAEMEARVAGVEARRRPGAR